MKQDISVHWAINNLSFRGRANFLRMSEFLIKATNVVFYSVCNLLNRPYISEA